MNNTTDFFRTTRCSKNRVAFNLICLLLIGIAFSGNSARADFLINGSFESVDASTFPYFIRSNTSTPGWTQFGDGVDLIHNLFSSTLLPASDGSQFLDMNQSGSLGGILQVVSANVGVTYRLELDTAAWATNSIGGTIGYQLYDPASSTILAQGSYTDNIGGTWVTRSLEATAISSQIGVRIEGLQATQAGMGLDNVRLSAVPEPSSFLFVTVAVASVKMFRRRSRLRSQQ